jgi:hypothetical protein
MSWAVRRHAVSIHLSPKVLVPHPNEETHMTTMKRALVVATTALLTVAGGLSSAAPASAWDPCKRFDCGVPAPVSVQQCPKELVWCVAPE